MISIPPGGIVYLLVGPTGASSFPRAATGGERVAPRPVPAQWLGPAYSYEMAVSTSSRAARVAGATQAMTPMMTPRAR